MSNNDYEHASQVWTATKDYDTVLQHLRDKGFSKLDSIKALREFCGLSLGESKRTATLSKVWADTLEQSNQLHDAFFEDAKPNDAV